MAGYLSLNPAVFNFQWWCPYAVNSLAFSLLDKYRGWVDTTADFVATNFRAKFLKPNLKYSFTIGCNASNTTINDRSDS
jgi:hypothetical protein